VYGPDFVSISRYCVPTRPGHVLERLAPPDAYAGERKRPRQLRRLLPPTTVGKVPGRPAKRRRTAGAPLHPVLQAGMAPVAAPAPLQFPTMPRSLLPHAHLPALDDGNFSEDELQSSSDEDSHDFDDQSEVRSILTHTYW